ncbi:MAG: ROK family protein [Bacteroidales bacterium]|nr:ROK family protein [Bacteroidales bacterium]
MYKYATSIGLDIGRSMIRTALVRYDNKLIDSFNFPYNRKLSREILLNNILESISVTREKATGHNINPICIGIAAKGFIDFVNGVVIGPDQGISGWSDVSLNKIVTKSTGLPTYVDNDANLMAIAELACGVGAGFSNIIYVALRSGIGGAIIIDGKLYRGANNAGGEIGQISIDLNGPVSNIGIKGSLEHFASSVALVRRYIALSGIETGDKKKMANNLKAIDVFNLSYQGDNNAVRAVSENASYVGAGLASLISIFSPQIIILGGGMSLAKDTYIDQIRRKAFENSLEECHKDVKIVRASLGNAASLHGASIFALTRIDGKQI